MNYSETGIFEQEKVKIRNLLPDIGIEQARKEIIEGLSQAVPEIPSKYFYDEKGSLLFEEITRLKEYYPTRTEKIILQQISNELMNRQESFEVVELGSGDCSKISILMDAVNGNMSKVKYLPVDFSQSAISVSANVLRNRYPKLEIEGYVADFIHQLDLIPHSTNPRMICFLGSTIGNFTPIEAREMVEDLSKGLFENDTLLIGFDLVKPNEILHAAYNDTQGVTAQFNKNILNVVNTIVQSDFDLIDFDHHAFFNKEKSRIEMHLKANREVAVHSPHMEKEITFKKGDTIHTENSHKYSKEAILKLIDHTGLKMTAFYTDPNNWFALAELSRMV